MKLSNTQLQVLKELSIEGNFLHYMAYAGRFNPISYWFFDNSLKRVRFSTERYLYNNGLLTHYKIREYNNLRAKITDKGRKFLEENHES